jgi:tetratricopeptide (TPR) repeat protein
MAKDRKQAKAAQRQAKLKAKRIHQEQITRVRNRIEDLFDEESLEEAVERLELMHRSSPQNRDIFRSLLDGYLSSGNYREIRRVCKPWLAQHRQDREIWRLYTGACLQDGYVHRGLMAARTLVELWPDHEDAEGCQQMIGVILSTLPETLKHFGSEGSDEALTCHEDVREAVESGQFQEAVRLARQGLSQWPTNQPMRNNLCQALNLLGLYDESIRESRQEIARNPSNVFAHANLTRAVYLLGRDAEAQLALKGLLACDSDREERWAKTAEILAVMGEDQRLLDLARPVIAQNLDRTFAPIGRAQLRHFAACAEYRLGDESAAKRLWKESIQISRIPTAEENLADLQLPIDDRHAAWFLAFGELFSRQAIDDLLKGCAGKPDAAASEYASAYFKQHPELRQLCLLLLDRGDPIGRQLACSLCKIVADDEALDMLVAFAHGRRGSLEMRLGLTEFLIEKERIQPGPFETWLSGKPSTMLAYAFQICFEPMEQEKNRVVEVLHQRANDALHGDNLKLAESLFEKALALSPDQPSLHFNLASTRQFQRGFDFEAAVRQIHARWPDYNFARMALAKMLASSGQVEAGRALIKPMMERTKLHFTEFRLLAMCQVEMELAEGNITHARSWLDMASRALPDDAALHDLLNRQILAKESPVFLESLTSLLRLPSQV